MKSKRFRQERAEGPRGFSRWVQPQMHKYLLACCDCGLVHEMQFRVVGMRKMRVQFRARRAPRYTAKLRQRLRVEWTEEAADKSLEDTLPLILYFGSEQDREEFMAIVREAKPGMMAKKIP